MIDYQTYRKFHSTASAFAFSHTAKALYDQWPDSISNTKTLSEDNLMLLPPDIHGFFLKEKRWGKRTKPSFQKGDTNLN